MGPKNAEEFDDEYVNYWKQFIFYILRTSLLDEATRDRIYGIRFSEDQLMIIQQLLQMLFCNSFYSVILLSYHYVFSGSISNFPSIIRSKLRLPSSAFD